uniref:probable RNA-binding protein EIF1AD isoform X2 n=1 Tax=Oncorhynchus gorbuscha TaxID=8017 RepID=UPI001EAF10E3|nr:probable RNA-binding protein EIF1AD isoform X2 [Oncorhynchus gorbuscha]
MPSDNPESLTYSKDTHFLQFRFTSWQTSTMSQATKRKHVVKEQTLDDYVTPTENQQIVRVLGSRGNNLHEAVTAQGENFLISMPPKFRKNLWIKRGDYVIVDPIEEGEKVRGEISFILYRDHIQHLQKLTLWPEAFTDEPPSEERTDAPQPREGRREKVEDCGSDHSTDSEDDESDLFVNTNRCNVHYSESEEDSEDEKDEGEDKVESSF